MPTLCWLGLPCRFWISEGVTWLKIDLRKKKKEFPLPAFLLWSILIPQDTEMSNCGQACEELIFSQCLGTSHQTVLYSLFWAVQKYSPPGVYTLTHIHTNGTWDLCNRWKWVIWIRSDYRARISEEEGKKERGEWRLRRERESEQKGACSKASTTTPLTTGDTERVCVCLSSARFKDIHETVICFDSQSHPSSLVHFTIRPPPPPLLSEWLTFTEIRLQHHTKSHILDGELKPALFLALHSASGVLKEGGLRGGGGARSGGA